MDFLASSQPHRFTDRNSGGTDQPLNEKNAKYDADFCRRLAWQRKCGRVSCLRPGRRDEETMDLYLMDCQLRAMRKKHASVAHSGLREWATSGVSVWSGGRAESTASVH